MSRIVLVCAALLAAAAIGDDYGPIAARLLQACGDRDPCRIAVLPFPHLRGGTDEASAAARRALAGLLGEAPKVRVLEARGVEEALEKAGLEPAGLLEPGDAVRLARRLGADLLVTGRLIASKRGWVSVNARASRGSDGALLAAAQGWVRRKAGEPEAGVGESLFVKRCSMCHGADARGMKRAVAVLGVRKEALDLTDADTSVRTEGDLRSHVERGGPGMPPHGNLPGFYDRLSREELGAILKHLRGLQRPAAARPKEARGRRSYERRCAYCHGEEGRGDSRFARELGVGKGALDLTAKDLSAVSVDGLLSRLKEGGRRMPAVGSDVGEREAADLLRYLHCLAP